MLQKLSLLFAKKIWVFSVTQSLIILIFQNGSFQCRKIILISQHFSFVFNVTNVNYKFLNVIKVSLVMSQKIVFNVAKMGFNVEINGFLRLH